MQMLTWVVQSGFDMQLHVDISPEHTATHSHVDKSFTCLTSFLHRFVPTGFFSAGMSTTWHAAGAPFVC